MEKQKISILILSCYAFNDMWQNNLSLLDKNWPSHPRAYLVSDKTNDFLSKRIIEFPNCEMLVFDLSMSDRIIESLANISSEYILLTLDDYYISSLIQSNIIDKLIDLMNEKNISYCRLFKQRKISGPFLGDIKYKAMPLQNVYEVNFYPSIWRTDVLRKVLKPNEDIWKTEVRLTRRMRENGFSGIAVYNKNVFPFIDIVRKGKYLRNGLRFIKKNNLYISDRPKQTICEQNKLFIKTFCSDFPLFPKALKRVMKEKYKKSGGVIYSDFENTDD